MQALLKVPAGVCKSAGSMQTGLPREPLLSPVCLAWPQASELSFDALQLQLKVRAINPHPPQPPSAKPRSTVNDLTLSPALDSALLLSPLNLHRLPVCLRCVPPAFVDLCNAIARPHYLVQSGPRQRILSH